MPSALPTLISDILRSRRAWRRAEERGDIAAVERHRQRERQLGDQLYHALQSLLECVARRFQHYLYACCGLDFPDAISEAWLRIWQAIDHYVAQRGRFEAFLYAVVANHYRDLARHARRIEPQSDLIDLVAQSPPREASLTEWLDADARADVLPVLELTAQGYTLKEIGQRESLTISAVHRRLEKGRRALRAALGERVAECR